MTAHDQKRLVDLSDGSRDTRLDTTLPERSKKPVQNS